MVWASAKTPEEVLVGMGGRESSGTAPGSRGGTVLGSGGGVRSPEDELLNGVGEVLAAGGGMINAVGELLNGAGISGSLRLGEFFASLRAVGSGLAEPAPLGISNSAITRGGVGRGSGAGALAGTDSGSGGRVGTVGMGSSSSAEDIWGGTNSRSARRVGPVGAGSGDRSETCGSPNSRSRREAVGTGSEICGGTYSGPAGGADGVIGRVGAVGTASGPVAIQGGSKTCGSRSRWLSWS